MKRLRRLALLPLVVYQRWISPWKPAMCRFTPTCSQYAIEAIETHGFVRGGARALWRLARCHPLCRGGFDPVPGGPSELSRSKHPGCGRGNPCARCSE